VQGAVPHRIIIVKEVWGWFWLSESLQDFDESFHRSVGMRAGLSTRRRSCGGLISMGAGLPTQRGDWGLKFCLFFVVQDMFSELRSFSRGHCFEKGSHFLYSHFSRLATGHLGAVSGIVPFLLTRVTRLSYMYFVSFVQCVGRLCGTRSTGHHVSCLGACLHILAYPSQERSSSSRHVVVHVPFVHLVPCLPNVLCRSGFLERRSQV